MKKPVYENAMQKTLIILALLLLLSLSACLPTTSDNELAADNAAIATNQAQVNAARAALAKQQQERQDDIDRLQIGMSLQTVVAIAGTPDKVNRTTTADGEEDQFVYYANRDRLEATYIYIENGVVSAIQDD